MTLITRKRVPSAGITHNWGPKRLGANYVQRSRMQNVERDASAWRQLLCSQFEKEEGHFVRCM